MLEQCLAYIQGNIDYLDHYLKTYMPKIKAMLPMASYLVWLDCRELNLSQQQLEDFFCISCAFSSEQWYDFWKRGYGIYENECRMSAFCT